MVNTTKSRDADHIQFDRGMIYDNKESTGRKKQAFDNEKETQLIDKYRHNGNKYSNLE